jgi:hypothetical protein
MCRVALYVSLFRETKFAYPITGSYLRDVVCGIIGPPKLPLQGLGSGVCSLTDKFKVHFAFYIDASPIFNFASLSSLADTQAIMGENILI